MSYRNLQYLIALGESLNFHEAAQQLHLSPQYLSHFIAGLEEEYGVKLFFRKPRLCLTYEGELLLSAARDILFYEKNFESEWQDLCMSSEGSLHVGYSSESIRMILPQLLSCYREVQPNVRITIVEEAEEKLLNMLEDGQIDLCLGIHLKAAEHTVRLPLSHEKTYLLIADGLLRRYFPNDYPLCAERFGRGAELQTFRDIPFLNNLSEAFLYQTAQRYSKAQGFKMLYTLSSGSTEALIGLCRQGTGAMLCSERYVPYLKYSNLASGGYVYCFPLIGLPEEYHLDLAYAKDRHIPRYVMTFVRSAQSLFDRQLDLPDVLKKGEGGRS